jgi:hypothetical protein
MLSPAPAEPSSYSKQQNYRNINYFILQLSSGKDLWFPYSFYFTFIIQVL